TIIKSPTCKTTCIASLLESQLNCSDCVYQPFCGTCPVLNLAQDNDLFFKNINSFRCKVYKGILDKLFTVLKDGKQLNILEKWLD
ncbi:MAG: His-Xaa-Ser system radical SAM maturase HxsB, partial [Lachnospiraceae bacterium]|nr:His-Xaa-Ser system radical SAM maturase HxsB [Lachnospiraceae bacterium]